VNADELTGRARTHIVELPDGSGAVHHHVKTAFESMRRAAATDGFELVAESSFRDFDRQLAIWNDKYSGKRPMFDAAGRPLDVHSLTPAHRITEILRWSALPGASRHHWGTDLDLIDRKAIPPDYRVQLLPAEFAGGGIFAPFGAWLEANAGRFGFFRPYRGIRSGVQPEPWHFSFAPVSEFARRALKLALLRDALAAAPLLGKEEVLANLAQHHARYVAAIDWP
jgi:LAS superfamily LD-carboxypeptidase LdcB